MAHIETFIQSAWQHLRADRPKQAMDCAKKALAISPNSPDVAHLLGLLASRDGNPEIALPLLQKAIDTGGKTPHRLRHMAEALLVAGYPEVALTPINDAIQEFGESVDLLGLKSAIEIGLEQWDNAMLTAQKAIDLNPNLMAWDLNLSIAQLMTLNLEDGFKNATARIESLKLGSLCPALMYSKPCTLWLKGEQGIGDTLFFMRYVVPLVKKGWQFHLEVDRKLLPLLQNSQLFLSVKEKNNCPKGEICFSIGDLPLMALQCGISEIPPPLSLTPDKKLVEKYRAELAKIGPAPYITVTWRAGPKGQKHRAGIRALEKLIDPTLLGGLLAKTNATIISLQRLPLPDEALAFAQALGRKPADYSALNNNLPGMLALLSLVDDYYTVSNSNLHLREGLAKPSNVFINRPFQDWRWQTEGEHSVWYPSSKVYRQEKDKSWLPALNQLSHTLDKLNQTHLKTQAQLLQTQKLPKVGQDNTSKHEELIHDGWEVVTHNIPEAIAKARAVLMENPKNARALHLLGWAAVQDLKFDLGLSVLSQATQLEPNNGNIWRDFIRAHLLLDQPTEALKIGEHCLANPNLWAKGVVYYALGSAYSLLEDDLNALECFERCMALIPNHLDAATTAALTRFRLGDHYARLGFKLNTARGEARGPNNFPYWVCPLLKGNVAGLKVLIVRSMGFGDELSYLRYLPYLINAGVHVTYWSGYKLAPLLSRLPYSMTVIPDTEPIPDPTDYDLAFIKNELPIAVEHLGAPEIADSLPLVLDQDKLEQWRTWLKAQGDGPYIGVTWRAGVGGNVKDAFSYTRLSKKVELADFAKALAGINATFISLTRNITKDELNAFEQYLGCPIIDVAGITDDLDDLLCIQYLLDENIGVSNTNMHLRACLGLGSKVLVSIASRDWRWGTQGHTTTWFKGCKVYRESKVDDWKTSLKELRQDLVEKYGLANEPKVLVATLEEQPIKRNKKIIWVTAGEIRGNVQNGYHSKLSSAQERVVNVAKLLASKGWQSEFLNESVSELMGGWHDKLPVKGDVVVFSKVFTDHAITLMKDAKVRGATVIVDIFNDFAELTKRAIQQQKMIEAADLVVSCLELKHKWERSGQPIAFYFENINNTLSQSDHDEILVNWLQVLETTDIESFKTMLRSKSIAKKVSTPETSSKPTQRLIWLTAGEIKNENGQQTSNLASSRYRLLIPSQALTELGWTSEIVNENNTAMKSGWGDSTPKAGDTVIISKVFTNHAVIMAKDAKCRGAKVVLDMCDNFLSHPKFGALQRDLLECADLLVTSTPSLKNAFAEIGKHADAVISDPVEFKRGEIKFAPNHVLNLVWFGHPVNIDTLAEFMPALAKLARTTPLQLNVVTTLPNGQQDLEKITPTGLKATYTQWSVSATEEAITNCDMVVIPTLQNDTKDVKSPNRLLEPLWAGRMVVAGPLPSYLPFADSAWIGKDIAEGIAWCLAHPSEVKSRITHGQADIEKYFTAQAIGHQWHQVLSTVHQQQTTHQRQAEVVSPLADYLQLTEVARILTTQETNYDLVKEQYFQQYPVKYNLNKPRIAVYTAIFGGYDTAPVLNYVDQELDYILYTDQSDFNAPAPWQVRVVPAMFADPQMDARRIKVLSHLFLADYDVTVWIDGNFTIEKLTEGLITDIASRAPVALCKHQFRNCIYDEAVEILKRGIDASTPVLRQMQYYQAHAFPRKHGLHATSFLVRNQKDTSTIKMNMRWWELLSTNSKRDQLSFDFVRWEQNVPVMTLPWNLRDNTLYFWGKNSERKHKVDVRRNDEHEGRALNIQTTSALTAHVYLPTFDQWHQLFVQDLSGLNQALINQTGVINTSILYAQPTSCAQNPPDVRLGVLQRETLNKLMHAKRILQIGFDGGHLALIALHHSGAKVVVVDDEANTYKQAGFDYLSKHHTKLFARFSMHEITQLNEPLFDLICLVLSPSENQEAILKKIKPLIGANTHLLIHHVLQNQTPVQAKSVVANHAPNSKQSEFTKSAYGVWLKNRKDDLTWRFAVQGKYGFFYSEWLKKQSVSIFIDIGANIGLYSLIANTNPNFKAIYSFEPHPETFQYLLENIERNHANKCKAYALAIADKCETQTIHVKPNHSGVATLRDVKSNEGYQSSIDIVCIDAKKLESLVDNPSKHPISIKIDVEGFELVVIKTLMNTSFWQQVKNIYYEVDENYLDFKAVEELLLSEGFRFEAKNGDGSHYDLLFSK